MKIKSLLASFMLLSAVSMTAGGNEYAHLYDNLPFEMPVIDRPAIPSRQVDLKEFGGVGDGITLNTKAFAEAIDKLSKQGWRHTQCTRRHMAHRSDSVEIKYQSSSRRRGNDSLCRR